MDGCEMSTAMMIKAAFLVQLLAHYCAFIISARNNFSISFTMFENYSKCRILIFNLGPFNHNLCSIKTDRSGNTV